EDLLERLVAPVVGDDEEELVLANVSQAGSVDAAAEQVGHDGGRSVLVGPAGPPAPGDPAGLLGPAPPHDPRQFGERLALGTASSQALQVGQVALGERQALAGLGWFIEPG